MAHSGEDVALSPGIGAAISARANCWCCTFAAPTLVVCIQATPVGGSLLMHMMAADSGQSFYAAEIQFCYREKGKYCVVVIEAY